MDIERVIGIIRSLKEEGMTLSTGQIAGTKESGDDPPVYKGKRYIYGTGFRKNWLQRRKPPQ